MYLPVDQLLHDRKVNIAQCCVSAVQKGNISLQNSERVYYCCSSKMPGDDDHFKFYDALKYFERPPSDESDAWCYLPCKQLMSLDKKVSYIKWDSKKRRTTATSHKPSNAHSEHTKKGNANKM